MYLIYPPHNLSASSLICPVALVPSSHTDTLLAPDCIISDVKAVRQRIQNSRETPASAVLGCAITDMRHAALADRGVLPAWQASFWSSQECSTQRVLERSRSS
ncbi:unnamed protein product [Pleuronectes platessa]|uniref:Uncharacterized protein n=1 Tax=Pleuronectes platessa TaxID=8262 RepID=A0A9N7UY03_PLEPL|nr:unnamed protein product [Pleuronectes platessa]